MPQHHRAELCRFSEPSPRERHSLHDMQTISPYGCELHSVHNCRLHNGAGTLSAGRARHQRGLPGHLRETESVVLEEGSDQMTILRIKGVYRKRSRSPDKTSQDRFQPKRRKAAATGELSYADPSPQPNHWSGKSLCQGGRHRGVLAKVLT